jgi:prolyl oligopeptidase
MKILPCLVVTIVVLISCNTTVNDSNSVSYPETRQSDTADTYFDTLIADPYRWLEDDRSSETGNWVERQNETTQSYLSGIPYRGELKRRLEQLWDYEKLSSPFKEGDFTYFYKNDGLQNHYVLYRAKGDEDPEVFLDPNTFSEDGTTSLSALSFTKDGTLAAYLISEGGSDWRKAIVLNTATKEIVEDTLVDIKFSNIAWKGNHGFFYSSYDKPDGSELSARTDQHKVYFHKLGTLQKEDELIFGGAPAEKHRYIMAAVSEDERYLTLSAANSTSGNKLYLVDLEVENAPYQVILDHEDSDTYLLANRGSRLYLVTNQDAPNQKMVTVDASEPGPEHWKDFIPETEFVLNPSKGGSYFFAQYMVDALSKIIQYDYEGKRIREIALPDIGGASGFSGKQNQDTLYFSFTNYKTPSAIFALEPVSGNYEIYWEPEIDFAPEDYVTHQEFYTSADGTRIPIIITHKKGLVKNGRNPTILYGYGGFNISLTPSFSVVNAAWMEQGGIYAVPNIRGGGEYGKEWHKAGTKLQKQNVFDDFIAAAEYLTKEGYTSPDYLALSGGSNGGLLVGAVMTQRPELMKVALPAVGVLDMLRYHTFTAGAGWSYDYGTSEDSEEMFNYLLGYSPLHNVKEGTTYPATLITTADHDDRVVPAHSFKFAATLQNKQAGNTPVMIRIETKAGHGAGTPIRKTIEQYADIFAFTLYNMGYKKLPPQEGWPQIKG